jgi:nucleotide-binding universal stress UspA family protein
MVKHIIWATDGSPTTRREYPVVEDLARSSGGKVIVAHAGEMVSSEKAGIFVDSTEVLQATLERTVQDLKDAGLDAELALVKASPGNAAESIAELAELAESIGADVVVAGNRGYGAVAALFLGSFTFRLLQIAPCPVLVVPTGGPQRTA